MANRTLRAQKRSCLETAESARKMKNEDIKTLRNLQKEAKKAKGAERIFLNRKIEEWKEYTRHDSETVRVMKNDVIIYKNRCTVKNRRSEVTES